MVPKVGLTLGPEVGGTPVPKVGVTLIPIVGLTSVPKVELTLGPEVGVTLFPRSDRHFEGFVWELFHFGTPKVGLT